MTRKILVPLDGSENAAKSLLWVRRYAAREKVQVLLLRVANLAEFGRESVHVELRAAREYLKSVESGLRDSGISVRGIAKVGDPATLILHLARREGCSLILMTTRGGSPIKRWAIGGVTEKILRLSPIPVQVVQSGAVPPRRGQVRRIVLPVDGSVLAETAIPWAVRISKLLKTTLVFLHVYPEGLVGLRTRHQGTFEALDQRMSKLCRRLEKGGLKAIFHVESGDPADRILAFASPADLIVTTTHGAGRFNRWVFGSVAEKLIHQSRVPVLVYKSADKGKLGVTQAS
jgi:nucleotide-binding universal stress UspA family protein